MAKEPEQEEKRDGPKPPDGGYGWVVLLSAFLISFILDGCMYSFGIVMTEIRKNFGASQSLTNLIYSLNTGVQFCSGTMAYAFAAQFGVRSVIMVAGAIMALMNLIVAFVPDTIYIVIAYGGIGGVAYGCTYLTCFIILVEYFEKKLGVANGLTMSGSGLGAFATPLITRFLIKNFDWKFTMVIYGCMIAQCVILGALMRPLTEKKTPKTIVKEIEMQRLDGETTEGLIQVEKVAKMPWYRKALDIAVKIIVETTNFRLLFQNLRFTLMCMSTFCIFFAYFLPFVFIPIRAEKLFGDKFVWVISVIGIVNIPARIIIGFIVDKKILSAVDFNTFWSFIATIAIAVYYFLNEFWMQLCFSTVYAISIAGLNCLSTPYVRDIVGKKKFGNANGILNIFRGVSCVVGPLIAGLIYDKYNNILHPFLFTSICYLFASLFSLSASLLGKIDKIREYREKRARKNLIIQRL